MFISGAFADQQRDCFYEVHFREDAPDVRGVGVQFEASWIVPSATEQGAEALWVQTVRSTFKHKKSVALNLHKDVNCLVSQFISTTKSKGAWGASHGQVAARRVPRDMGDNSFLILITIQVSTFVGSECHSSAGVEGWLRIENVPSHVGPLSRIQWFWKTLIQPPEVKAMPKSELGKWIRTVISKSTRSKFKRDLAWSIQALGNILISPKRTVAQIKPCCFS